MNALLQVGWTWHPSVWIGFSLWTVLYLWAIRGRRVTTAKQAAFHIGTLLGLIALVSPLDKLGDEYLFSAHMAQHLLLMFVTAPLWLIGSPDGLIDQLIPTWMKSWIRKLTSPPSAFLVFVGTLWFWHIPMVYQTAQGNETIHILEHLTFIGAALIGWWPVAGAEISFLPKPEPPMRILYLFLLALPCSALAAILTFAHTPLYPFYTTTPHLFGLDAIADLHLGGLLMWLPTHMILLLASGITFLNWFSNSERAARRVDADTTDEFQLPNETQKLGV